MASPTQTSSTSPAAPPSPATAPPSAETATTQTPAETATTQTPTETATAQTSAATTRTAATRAATPVSIPDLSAQLRPAILRASRRLRAEKADNELSDSQAFILAYLHNHGPSTPGTLAASERVTPPSMNRTINAVVEAGYALRTPSPDDGRKVVISLTPAGVTFVKETRRQRDAWLYQRLAELSVDDRETLLRASTILRALADS